MEQPNCTYWCRQSEWPTLIVSTLNLHQSGLVLLQVAAGSPSSLVHLALYKSLYRQFRGEDRGPTVGVLWKRVRVGPGERGERHVVRLWRWQITPPLLSPSPSLTNSQFLFHIFGPRLDFVDFNHQPITLLNRIHDSCPSVHTIFCYWTWCKLGLRVRVFSVISWWSRHSNLKVTADVPEHIRFSLSLRRKFRCGSDRREFGLEIRHCDAISSWCCQSEVWVKLLFGFVEFDEYLNSGT